MHLVKKLVGALAAVGAALLATALFGFPHAVPQPRLAQTSCGVFASVEQRPDNRVTFKICAPGVDQVQVVEDSGSAGPMTKDSHGIFTGTTTKPLKPDYYRYYFLVDGVRTVDPLATNFGENVEGVSGIFEVTGPELNFAAFHKNLPHGPTAELYYWSKTLDAQRRVHIYTPPGYPKDANSYPVLYLLHGDGDNDDAWGTIGRANAILDNLIASGEARKMIIVMPAGNVPPRGPNATAVTPGTSGMNDFDQDLLNEIIPLVESNYRTINDPEHRAIAGLSLGGDQALRIGLGHPDLFHYVGVFSASLSDPDDFDRRFGSMLDQSSKNTKLVYYALGKNDPLFREPAILTNVLARHGIKTLLNYSNGGHEWSNWRQYLADFARRLFR